MDYHRYMDRFNAKLTFVFIIVVWLLLLPAVISGLETNDNIVTLVILFYILPMFFVPSIIFYNFSFNKIISGIILLFMFFTTIFVIHPASIQYQKNRKETLKRFHILTQINVKKITVTRHRHESTKKVFIEDPVLIKQFQESLKLCKKNDSPCSRLQTRYSIFFLSGQSSMTVLYKTDFSKYDENDPNFNCLIIFFKEKPDAYYNDTVCQKYQCRELYKVITEKISVLINNDPLKNDFYIK